MNSSGNSGRFERDPDPIHTARIAPIAAGLTALAVTFLAAAAGAGGLITFLITACGAAIFLLVSVRTVPQRPALIEESNELVFEAEAKPPRKGLEDRLIALDEANEVFGSSLNAADMFRLVSSRVGEIFPFAVSALVVPDETGEKLRFVHSDGEGAEMLRETEIAAADGSAGRAFTIGKIVTENGLAADRKALGDARIAGFVSSAAIPLIHVDKPFGVLQLFLTDDIDRSEDTIKLLEAIAEHVTPIFRSSLAFERTLSSALTDTLTGLPNERAFYMVLENQLAECLRHRDERPLTILSIDIRDFGAVNSMLGHSVGDQMLEFAGLHIGEHLRKMDFLARTVNDEFSVILPTAGENTAFEIIERIREGFAQNEFEIADGEGVAIALNVGWATFWKDGETVQQLVRAAQQRKRQAKSEEPADVLWFPKEYVN